MSFGSKPKVQPAPAAPERTSAEEATLADAQRARLRGGTGIRSTSFTGGLGAPTSTNSVAARLLGGTA